MVLECVWRSENATQVAWPFYFLSRRWESCKTANYYVSRGVFRVSLTVLRIHVVQESERGAGRRQIVSSTAAINGPHAKLTNETDAPHLCIHVYVHRPVRNRNKLYMWRFVLKHGDRPRKPTRIPR